jgi:hypothetical protein
VVDDYDFQVHVERVVSNAAPRQPVHSPKRVLPLLAADRGAIGSFGR